jgi:hypothetical protein
VKWARIVILLVVLVGSIAALAVVRGNSDQPAATGSVTLPHRPATRPLTATSGRAGKEARAATLNPAFPPAATPLDKEFDPVLERSLFSSRHERAQEAQLVKYSEPPSSATPEASLVLCGVAQQGGEFTALVEDVKGGRVSRLSPGDSIGRGRLVHVDLDGAEYEVGGNIRRVRVGDDLNGGSPAIVSSDAPIKPSKSANKNKKPQKSDEPEVATSKHRNDEPEIPGKHREDPKQLAKEDRQSKEDRKKEEQNLKPKEKSAKLPPDLRPDAKVKGEKVAWPGKVN